jgi:hypothetical protein
VTGGVQAPGQWNKIGSGKRARPSEVSETRRPATWRGMVDRERQQPGRSRRADHESDSTPCAATGRSRCRANKSRPYRGQMTYIVSYCQVATSHPKTLRPSPQRQDKIMGVAVTCRRASRPPQRYPSRSERVFRTSWILQAYARGKTIHLPQSVSICTYILLHEPRRALHTPDARVGNSRFGGLEFGARAAH